MLESPQYLVFDEWWGTSKDSFSAVLGRERDAKRIKLRGGAIRWFEDDRQADHDTVLCWLKGKLFVSKRYQPYASTLPCFGDGEAAQGGREVCVFHMVHRKQDPAIASLQLTASDAQALMTTDEFAVSPHGVWLPHRNYAPLRADPNAAADSDQVLLGLTSAIRLSPPAMLAYLEHIRTCVDAVEKPEVWKLWKISKPRRWCYAEKRRRAGLCQLFNKTGRALCKRTCQNCNDVDFVGLQQSLQSAQGLNNGPLTLS